MTSKKYTGWLLAALVMFQTSTTFATNELRDELSAKAKTILDISKNQPVTIGQFSPTGLPNTHSGPGIELILKDELESISKGIVRDDAKYEIKGDYGFFTSRRNPSLKQVKISMRVIDTEFGEDVHKFEVKAEIGGNNSIAQMLQVTANIDPHGDKVSRNKELARRSKNPSVHITGFKHSLVSSASTSPYAVEMLVKPLANHQRKTAAARRANALKGLAFVDIKQNELYEVKLYNNSNKEVAASLSVDGLNMFHFSKDRNAQGKPRFTHTIIPPRSSVTVVGWHNSLSGSQNYLSFLVTGYGQGAVTKAGIKARGKVGVVHVQFAECKPLPAGHSARGGNETGFGPPRTVKQKAVRYEIEPPHDFVSIRYTRNN